MEFTAYMLDVLTEAIYPVRMVVEDGIFKEIELIFLEEDTVIDVEGVRVNIIRSGGLNRFSTSSDITLI